MKYYQDVRTTAKISTTSKILYVSQDMGNDSNDGSIFRPFKTIQAGLNAAALISAYYNQVIVRVTPSATGNGYNENLTFSQQGVILQAEPPTYRSDAALIKGTITVNLTGTSGGGNFVADSNIVYIKGFVITPASGDTITFSGTAFQRLFIEDSYIDNTGTGSALVMTNTGVSSGGVKSTINSRNVDWNNNSASNATIKVSAGRLLLDGANPVIQNSNASGLSVLVDGASATGPTVTTDNTSLTGQYQVTDNTSVSILTFSSISSGSAAAISTPSSPSTGYVFLGSVGLTTTATNSITGSGVVVLNGVAKFSTGGDIVGTVTQAVNGGFPQGATLIGAGSTQVTNALLAIKNGHLVSQQTTAPTSTLQAGAGSTATRTLTRCTDTGGHISLTVNGIGAAAGAQLVVTFNKVYNNAPVIALTPTNANAATLIGAYASSATNTWTLNFQTAGVPGTTYTFDYLVLET